MQQEIRDMILEKFPEFKPDDVRSTSMGAGGEDIQLSPFARECLPIQIECKNKEKSAVHSMFEQAKEHGKYEPVLIVKKNHAEALAVVRADFFFDLMHETFGEVK